MITIRPYKRRGVETGGYEVYLVARRPNGEVIREKIKSPAPSKTGTQRWAEARLAHLLAHGKEVVASAKEAAPPEAKKAPTLSDFWPQFFRVHLENKARPSSRKNISDLWRIHIVPVLGERRLDEVSGADVAQLKTACRAKLAPKTINSVLSVLRSLLNQARRWGLVASVPEIPPVPVPKHEAAHYTDAELERLLGAAKTLSEALFLVVLLGADAGLRAGEILALRWDDVRFDSRSLIVQRRIYKGAVEEFTKGGGYRVVPLTERLFSALKEGRHLRGPWVLSGASGAPVSDTWCHEWIKRAEALAGLTGGHLHKLRHTFCSRLAARGVAARVIQELAGHASFLTTQRYLHLAPDDLAQGIEALASPPSWRRGGGGR